MLGPALVFGTTLVPVNFVQLAESSQTAFVGTVTNIQSVKTSQGYGQQITVEIEESIFGIEPNSKTISWIQAKPSKNTIIPGMPQLAAGQKYMLFLTGKQAGSPFQAPQALGYGAFSVITDPSAGKAIARNSFMNVSLLKNIDKRKLSTAVANHSLKGKSFTSQTLEIESAEKQKALEAKTAGATDLKILIETARTIKDLQKNGSTPSNYFSLQHHKKYNDH